MRVVAKDGSLWRVRRTAVAVRESTPPVRRMETGDKFTDDYTFARAAPAILLVRAVMSVGAYAMSLVVLPFCILGSRPWFMTAHQVGGHARRTHVWQVRGNRESLELVAGVASALQRGHRLSGVGVEFSDR